VVEGTNILYYGNQLKWEGFVLEFEQFLQMQREFDRKVGWNAYEKCRTLEDVLQFMEHFVLVTVEELGEISRVRKQYYRDKKDVIVDELKHELMDIFVYFMQACMALNLDLKEEYLKKLRSNEKRFINKNRRSENPKREL
jgi:NTP pyrophosphatase (non-canonical NTP hydrolase)